MAWFLDHLMLKAWGIFSGKLFTPLLHFKSLLQRFHFAVGYFLRQTCLSLSKMAEVDHKCCLSDLRAKLNKKKKWGREDVWNSMEWLHLLIVCLQLFG